MKLKKEKFFDGSYCFNDKNDKMKGQSFWFWNNSKRIEIINYKKNREYGIKIEIVL